MKLTNKKYLNLVASKLIAIKKHATKKEINKLEITTLNPRNMENYIYGQMTGDCRSARAVKLINLCCASWIKQHRHLVKRKPLQRDRSIGAMEYFSNLESYIIHTSEENLAEIVDYLKGNRKKLPTLE